MAVMSDSAEITLSEHDKQVLILRRQWELIEGLKQQRNQLPVLVCTVLLGATAFVLNSDRLPSSKLQAVGICVLLLAIAATGVWVNNVIHKQYDFVNNRINYLYRHIGITGENYFPDEGNLIDNARALFFAVYTVIIAIGLICAIGVLFAPIQHQSSRGEVQVSTALQSDMHEHATHRTCQLPIVDLDAAGQITT